MEQPVWERFSTDTVIPSQRIHRWNDYGSETLCNLTVDPQDREEFTATLKRIEFGPLGLITMSSTGATARGLGGVGGWAVAETDALLLVLPESGHCSFRQNNITSVVEPGSMFLRDMTRPWVHSCDGPMQVIMLKIPFTVMASRIEDPARLLGETFPAHMPAVAAASDIIRSVRRTLNETTDPELHDVLSDLVLDAMRMLYQSSAAGRFGPKSECSDRQQRAALRRNAMSHIIRHLDNCELSVANIAAAIGVSERGLQRAFVEAGKTPSQFILEQRLDRAAAFLSGPHDLRAGSILDIAFSVGFNDASHFSRSFSRRFGVSPREYRSRSRN